MNPNSVNPPISQPAGVVAVRQHFRFESTTLLGATMNRYGIVTCAGHPVSPAIRGVVLREALAAGCRLVPDPNPDLGLVWTLPETSTSS